MGSELATFVWPEDENQRPIRTLMIDGEPWFVAADVCAVLGLANTGSAVTSLRNRMKGIQILDTPGGPQEMIIISESGVYRLVMRSSKPNAEVFQDWIAEEVVPSIRKTGSYIAPQQTILSRAKEAGSVLWYGLAEFLQLIVCETEENKKDIVDIKHDVSGLRVVVGGLQTKVDGMEPTVNGIKERKAFPQKSRDRFDWVVLNKCNGCCPVTGEKLFNDKGEKIPGSYEYDHWNRSTDNRESQGWLVSKVANQKILPNNREQYHHIFLTFQTWLKQLRDQEKLDEVKNKTLVLEFDYGPQN